MLTWISNNFHHFSSSNWKC